NYTNDDDIANTIDGFEKAKETVRKNIASDELFNSIGYTDIKIIQEGKESTVYYQVAGRYYRNLSEEIFEFIFNDISKLKVIEEANAEIKYRSLFLAKVAHEFKNPLICITELIDEIFEHLSFNFDMEEIKTCLNNVKSMSDY